MLYESMFHVGDIAKCNQEVIEINKPYLIKSLLLHVRVTYRGCNISTS